MAKTLNIISRTNTTTNWSRADPYSDNDLHAVKDPEGAVATKQVTSIPSPFARIDLFKTAFQTIVSQAKDKTSGGLDGTTMHHRLVSEALDMAQLFFRWDTLKETDNHISIIAWDRETQLNALKNSPNDGHRIFAETLELFLEQDRESYHFDRWRTVFILKYNYFIVGGTSPSTLFFTTANDIFAKLKIKFGNDTLFDTEYCPLYKRETDFQRYMHLLFTAHAEEFGRAMPEMKAYLDQNLDKLRVVNNPLFLEISQAISAFNLDAFKAEYMELDAGVTGQTVQVLGVPLRKRKRTDGNEIAKSSDFVIASAKCSEVKKPLVLQRGFNKPNFNYVSGGVWDANTPVPYADAAPLEKRRLPGQQETYPYLTVDDFLEPYLIKMPYPLNHEQFFNGNWKGAAVDGYLLPIKPLYLDYFDINSLKELLPNGLPKFSMEGRIGGGVAAVLRIPIAKSGEFVTLERIYLPSASPYEVRKPIINESQNDGTIVECSFGVAIAPFVQLTQQNLYRIAMVDADYAPHTQVNEYQLTFFQNTAKSAPLAADMKQRSNKRLNEGVTTKFYNVKERIDAISVSNGLASGMLVPQFKPHNGTAQYSFAVDFGTTNTHIELSIDRGTPMPFEVGAKDMLFGTSYPFNHHFDIAPEIKDLILHEFLPELLGKTAGSEFVFPFRTATSEHINLDHSKRNEGLIDINIPFYYEKYPSRANAKIQTNLKWSNFQQADSDAEDRVNGFIETLTFMMRCKVLANGGNPLATRLTWFYPSSMTVMHRNKLRDLWATYFDSYFTKVTDTNLRGMSESVAPYYHYKTAEGVSSLAYPAVSIDIGGGTTDVVIFVKDELHLLTSFRFAGNALFGDGYNRDAADRNGFVQRFRKRTEDLLQSNRLNDFQKILNDMGRNSADIISYFFSLENNPKLKNAKIDIPFSKWLASDEELKIVPLVFYGAIVYHIAKLMKKSNLPMPRYLCFGGNGSKIISALDNSSNLEILTQFSKLMIEQVYGAKYGDASQTDTLNLKKVAEPKELTCKGGLYETRDIRIDDKMVVLVGDASQTLVNNASPIFPEKRIKYNEIEAQLHQDVCTEVRTFIDTFTGLNYHINYNRNFGVNISKLDFYTTQLKTDLMQYLLQGIDQTQKLGGMGNQAEIEESLFFFPLVGALNNLATRIIMP